MNKTVKISVPASLIQFSRQQPRSVVQQKDTIITNYVMSDINPALIVKSNMAYTNSNIFLEFETVHVAGYFPKMKQVLIVQKYDNKYYLDKVSTQHLFLYSNKLTDQQLEEINYPRIKINTELFIQRINVYDTNITTNEIIDFSNPTTKIQESSYLQNKCFVKSINQLDQIIGEKNNLYKQLYKEIVQMFQSCVTQVINNFNGPDILYFDEQIEKSFFSFDDINYGLKCAQLQQKQDSKNLVPPVFKYISANYVETLYQINPAVKRISLQDLTCQTVQFNFQELKELTFQKQEAYIQAKLDLQTKHCFQPWFIDLLQVIGTIKTHYDQIVQDALNGVFQSYLGQVYLDMIQNIQQLPQSNFIIFLLEKMQQLLKNYTLQYENFSKNTTNKQLKIYLDQFAEKYNDSCEFQFPFLNVLVDFQQIFIPVCRFYFAFMCMKKMTFKIGIRTFDSLIQQYVIYVHESLFRHIKVNFFEFYRQKEYKNDFDVILPEVSGYEATSKSFQEAILKAYEFEQDNSDKLGNILISIRRKTLFLQAILNNFGYQDTPDRQYSKFPFQFEIELSLANQGQEIITSPNLLNCVQIYKQYIQKMFINMHSSPLSFEDEEFSPILDEFLQSQANMSYYTERQQFLQIISLKLAGFQINRELLPNIDEYFEQFGSVLSMTIDIFMQSFNLEQEVKTHEEFKSSFSVSNYYGQILKINTQNQQLSLSIQQKEDININDIFIVQLLQDLRQNPSLLPVVDTKPIHQIINYDLRIKNIFANVLEQPKYFYCTKIDTSSIQSYFQQSFQKFIQEGNQKLTTLTKSFAEGLVNNMRAFYNSIELIKGIPQYYGKMVQINNVFSQQNCANLYSELVNWTTKSSQIIISEFGQDGYSESLIYSQQIIVDKYYEKHKQITNLEQYVSARLQNQKYESEEDFSEFEHYEHPQLKQYLQEQYVMLYQQIQEINYNNFDQIEQVHQALFVLSIHVKNTCIQIFNRSQAYQSFQLEFQNYLINSVAKLNIFVEEHLFVNLQNIFSQNNELENLFSQIDLNVDFKAKKHQIVFEKEYMNSLQKATQLNIYSDSTINVENQIKPQKTRSQALNSLVAIYQDNCENNNYKNLLLFQKSFNLFINTVKEIFILENVKIQWDQFLNLISEDQSKTNFVISNITNLIKYLSPLSKIFDIFFQITSTHCLLTQNYLISYYPVLSFTTLLKQYYKFIVIFKTQYREFFDYMRKNSIQIDQQFLFTLDNLTQNLTNQIFEITIFDIIKSKKLLPRDISDLGKQFDIFLDSDLIIPASKLIEIYQKQSIQLFDTCIDLSIQMNKNYNLFRQLLNVYQQISQIKVNYVSHDDLALPDYKYFTVHMSQPSLIQFLNNSILFINAILLSQQKLVIPQVIIFARDMEALVMNIQELYYFLLRSQLLLNDLIMVRSLGYIIELDMDTLEQKYIENNYLNLILNYKNSNSLFKKRLVQKPRKLNVNKEIDNKTDQQLIIKSLHNFIDTYKKKISDQQQRRIEKINIMSETEQKVVQEAYRFHQNIREKLLQKDNRLVNIITQFKQQKTDSQKNPLKEAIRILMDLEFAQSRLYNDKFQHVFERFQKSQKTRLYNQTVFAVQTQYDIFDMGDDQKFQLNFHHDQVLQNLVLKSTSSNDNYLQFKLEQSQLVVSKYNGHGIIIPKTDDQIFPQSLLSDFSLSQIYSQFKNWYTMFLTDQQLKDMYFDNIDHIEIQPSITRNLICMSISSGGETLVFQNPVECPTVLYKFPDLLLNATQQCVQFYVTLGVQYLITQKFELFIKDIPYQFQLNSLYMDQDLATLNLLKEFLKQNKNETNIPIMCRLEEFLCLKQETKAFNIDIQLAESQIKVQSLYAQSQWLGSPIKIEYELLTLVQMRNFFQIIQSLHLKQTTILCQPTNSSIKTKKMLKQTQQFLSRLLARKHVDIHFTAENFMIQIRQLIIYIINGYLVYLHGLQYLQVSQLSEIIELIYKIQQRQGSIPEIYQVDLNLYKVNEIVDKKFQIWEENKFDKQKQIQLFNDDQSLHLSSDDIVLSQSNFSHFSKSMGYFVIVENIVEDQHQSDLVEIHLDDFVQFESQHKTVQFLKKFDNIQIINLAKFNDNNKYPMLNEFVTESNIFGNQFYQLSQILSSFDQKFPKLVPQDIGVIIKLCNNPNDTLNLCIILLDYLLRQYLDLFSRFKKQSNQNQIVIGFPEYSSNNIRSFQKRGQKQKPVVVLDQQAINLSLLSNLISSIFELNKQQQSQLVTQSKSFTFILQKNQGNVKSKVNNFVKYFQTYILPNFSQQANGYINNFVTNNQVSLSLSYEIFMLLSLLQFKKPILIQSNNIQYTKILITYLQNTSQQKRKNIIFVCSQIELLQIKDYIQVQDIVCIIPTSLIEFQVITQFLTNSVFQQQVIVILPMSDIVDLQTQQYISFYEKRFISLPDLNDIVGIQLYLFSNKNFNFTFFQSSVFEKLIKGQERYVHSTNLSQKGTSTRLLHLKLYRLNILSQIFKALYITIFDQLQKIFILGQTTDDYMLLRSCIDFYLVRFGVIEPKSQLKTYKTQLQTVQCNSQSELEQISDYFSQNLSDQLKLNVKEQSQQMKLNLNSLNKHYQLNFHQSVSNLNGFNPNDIFNSMQDIVNKQNIDTKVNIMSIIKSIQSNTKNYGIGSQGSLQFQFSQSFLNDRYLKHRSAYESFIELMQPLTLAIWNSFSLVSQFSQKQIIISKKYLEFYDFYANFDLEKVKFTNLQLFQYKTPLNIVLFEHNQDIYTLKQLEIKNKYSSQQIIVKQLFNQMIEYLPKLFPQKQFSYLSYEDFSVENKYSFVTYNFSKGILKNVDLHKFISVEAFKKSTSQSKSQVNANNNSQSNLFDELENSQDFIESDSNDDEQNTISRINTMMQILPKDFQPENDAQFSLSTIINKSMKFNKFEYDNKQELDIQFKKQFANSNFMKNSIDVQQIEQSMPLYFDDERIALSVLIACSMMTPITFAVIGGRFTGKSLLITVSKLLVRDMVQSHFAQINDYSGDGQVQLIQQTIASKYQKVMYPFFEPFEQEESYIDLDVNDPQQIPLIVGTYYKFLLQKYEKHILSELQANQIKFTQLKDKLTDILKLQNQLDKVSPRSTLKQSSEQLDKNFNLENQNIHKNILFQKQEAIGSQSLIYYYVQSFAFPNFHLHSSNLHCENIADNFVNIFRDHVIQQNKIGSNKLDIIQNEILCSKDSGMLQLSDTSILIELSKDVKQITNNIHFKFEIPQISIQFLRKYFKYLFIQKYTQMNDEWVSSFLNGMNLISGNLPQRIFQNFKFLNQVIKEKHILLPNYRKLVLQSKKFAKIDVNFTIEDVKREIMPDLWISLVGDYEQYGLQYEKVCKEIPFDQFFSTAVQSATVKRKGKPTLLQTIMALNQDDIFKQLNIYSLIISLKDLNINSQRIVNLLERFTSLNLLGYLNIDIYQEQDLSIQDTEKIKIKILHPWQNTQNHVQLYPTLLAVLTQSCLINEKYSSSYQQVTKAFGNKFANKLFYIIPPMLIDHELVQKKLSYRKIVAAFLKPVPTSTKIIYSFEQYLDKLNYRHLYFSGLQASGMSRQNPFFLAHIMQLYTQCSDYLDPYLLYSIYRIILQLIEQKNKNISILKTQIQTQIFQPYNYDGLTNFHGDDYLRNFKWLFAQLFQNYINEVSKDIIQTDKLTARSFKRHSSNQSAEKINQNEEVEEQENLIDEDLANQIDQQSDDQSGQSEHQQSIDFMGIQQSAIYCIKVPIYQIQLNSNANSNQYNLFIQVLSTVSQYSLMSADTFKSAFEQMNKTELELQEEDISDNASSYSKASKASSNASKASSIQSGNTQNQFDEETFVPQIANGMQIQNLGINQYRFFNNLQGSRKVIIDVNNLLQIIATTKAPTKKKTKTKVDKQQTNDLVESLRILMVELQANSNLTVDAIEYIVMLQIFRFSLLMSLGIKPMFCFSPFAFSKQMHNPQAAQQSKVIGIYLNSWLSNKLPTTKVCAGKLFSEYHFYQNTSQLGQRLTNYKERFTQDANNKKQKNVDQQKFGQLINDINYPDLSEYTQKFTEEPFDVIVVCPRSLLLRQSITNIPLLTTILQGLQQDTFMQHIFDHDELSTIMKMISLSLDLQYELPLKDLVSLLAVTFSVLIVDDTPKVESLTNEYGTVQLNEDNIQNFNVVGNIIEQMINAHDINQLRGLQFISKEQSHELTLNKFNTINFQVNNIIKLFELSNCQLPQNFQILSRFQIDYQEIQQTTAVVMVSVYKQICQISGKWSISFNEFSQTSSLLVNQIYQSIQEFFDNMNYLFIAFHFYESLAAPSQTKQQMVDIFEITAEQIKKKIEQESDMYVKNSQNQDCRYVQHIMQSIHLKTGSDASKAIINNKYKSLVIDEQLYCSVQEAVHMRNYIFTIMEQLRTQYKFFEYQLQSAHLDGIIMASYLTYSQSELIDNQIIYDTIKSGRFAKLNGMTNNLTQLANEMPVEQMVEQYDMFLILMSCLIQEAGVMCDVSDIGIQPVAYLTPPDPQISKKTYTLRNPLLISGHKIIPNQIQNNFINTNSFDFPILLILDILNLQFKNNDPDLVNLYNIAINLQVIGKSTFLLSQDLLIPAACLLELMKKTQQQQDFTKTHQQLIQGQDIHLAQQLISDIKRRLIMIDLLLEPNKFNSLLCRVLSITDYMILFANYGPDALQDNCATLRKFLSLRSRRIIQKRQTIYIGQQSCVVNQALHKYKIIISYQSSVKLDIQLQTSGLFTQEFIDSACIIGSLKQKQTDNNQIDIMTQHIMQAVFTKRSTLRYYQEESRMLLAQSKIYLSQMKQYISRYFFYNVIDQTSQEQHIASQLTKDKDISNSKQQYEMEEVDFIEIINGYIASPFAIILNGVRTSFTLNSSLQQFDEFSQMLNTLKQVVAIEFQKQSFIFTSKQTSTFNVINSYRCTHYKKLDIKYQDNPISARCFANQICQSIGFDYARQMALAIDFIQKLFEGLADQFIQLECLIGPNLTIYVCQKIIENRHMLNEKVRAVLNKNIIKEKDIQNQIVLSKEYPIEVALVYEKQIVNEFLIESILPTLQNLITPLLDKKSSNSFYFLLNLVIFSLVQYDDCIQNFSIIQDYLKQVIQTLHCSQIDHFHQMIGTSLIQIFSANSKFQTPKDFTFENEIKNIDDLFPQITNMSDILVEAWFKLSAITNNSIIDDLLPFFLKHHSSFVLFTQCKYLFGSIIIYYKKTSESLLRNFLGKIDISKQSSKKTAVNNDEEEEEKDEQEEEEQEQEPDENLDNNGDFITLIKQILYDADNDEKQIQLLSPKLQEPSTQGFFAILLICNIMQPQFISDNVMLFQFLMTGFLNIQSNLNKQQINKNYFPNAENCVTGIFKKGNFTFQAERQRVMNKITQDFSPIYTSFLTFIDPYAQNWTLPQKLTSQIISTPLLIVCELIYTAINEISRYYQKIKIVMEKEEYDHTKHYQYLGQLGPTPDQIFVLFYEESIDIKKLIKFVFSISDLKILKNIPVRFSNKFDFEDMKDQIMVTIADPINGGALLLKFLHDIMLQKQQVYTFEMILPVFILIPIQKCLKDAKQLRSYRKQFQSLLQIIEPSFAVIQKPDTLQSNFTFSITQIMQVHTEQIIQNGISLSFQDKINTSFIKQLFIQMFVSQLANIQTFQTEIQASQYRIIYQQQISFHYDISRELFDCKYIQKIQDKFSQANTLNDIFQVFLGLLFKDLTIAQNKGVRYESLEDTDSVIEVSDEEDNHIMIEQKADQQQLQQKFETFDIDNFDENDQDIDDYDFRSSDGNSIEEDQEDENEIDIQEKNEAQDQKYQPISIEDSVYQSILNQLVLYDGAINIVRKLNIETIAKNTEKLLICQKRAIKHKNYSQLRSQILNISSKEFSHFENVDLKSSVREDIILFLFPIIEKIDKLYQNFQQPKVQVAHSYRTFISSYVVQSLVYPELFKFREIDVLPQLFEQFISNIKSKIHSQYVQTKTFSPKILFADIISPSINQDLNIILGGRQFGIFEHEWILNTCVFIDVLPEIFIFIKFRNAIVTGGSLAKQKVILLLEKLDISPYVSDEGEVNLHPSEGKQPFTIVFRELEFIGGTYDTHLESFIDRNNEVQTGYRQLFDVYCYGCTVQSNDQLKIPEGYVEVPMKINGRIINYVLIKNNNILSKEEFQARNITLTVLGI